MSDYVARNAAAGALDRAAAASARTRLLVIVAILAAALVALCGATILNGEWHNRQLAFARDQAVSVVQELVPLQDTIREIQVDIIQVQQFLTDASATHNPEAFAEAEKHSKHFYEGVAKVRDILARIENEEGAASVAPVRRQIDKTVDAFRGYREHGETMAHLYIDQRATLANDFMSVFDTTAEYLYVQLDTTIDTLRRISATRNEAAVSAMRSTEHAVSSSVRLAALLAVLAVIALVLAFRIQP